MRTRSAAVALLAAAIVAVMLAMCVGDEDGAPLRSDPSSSAAAETLGADVERERTPRRRVTGQRGGSETPDGGDPPNADAADEWIAAAEVPPGHGPPPPSGTVRVRMLDADGQPFEGGHVCFFEDELFVEPGPWDGVESSDGAYFGIAYYKGIWPRFDPVLGSEQPVPRFTAARGITAADGSVTVSVPADQRLVTFVRYGMSGIPLRSQPRVELTDGESVDLTIRAAQRRSVNGRCLDADGRPLPGITVQAVDPLVERPLSRAVATSPSGEFSLSVVGDATEVRVRAVVDHSAFPLGIYDAEEDVPPIPADTTVVGVVPGGEPIDIRMQPAPLVFIDVFVAADADPLVHLQIEGLAFDTRASAWGRLGGPSYRRGPGKTAPRRWVVALPRSEATRPLMLWSWGWTITAVDPRGADRVTVEIARGRKVTAHVREARAEDRLRIVVFCGPEGREIPCVWIDGRIATGTASGPLQRVEWTRDDCPVAAMEFQIVRDGAVVGRSVRVPAGTEPVDELVIDVR